jgi:hypothetical protein
MSPDLNSPDFHNEESADDAIKNYIRNNELSRAKEDIYDHIFGSDQGAELKAVQDIHIPASVQNDGITPLNNDGNRIDHDKEYNDYVIIDEKLRQALAAIYATKEISTAGALEELAKTGCQIGVNSNSNFSSKGFIYKLLTDGVILNHCSNYTSSTEIIFTTEGIRLPRDKIYGDSFYAEFYLIKHDSVYYYFLNAELKRRDTDNGIHGAGEPDTGWKAERDRLRGYS